MALGATSGGISEDNVAWSTGISVTVPSYSTGNLLALYGFRDEDDSGDYNTITGFTRETNLDGIELGGRDRVSYLGFRTASSEPASYTLDGTVATSRDIAGVIVAFSDSDGLDVTPTSSHYVAGENSYTPTNQPITTVTNGAMVVLTCGLNASGAGMTWVAPSGYTLLDSTSVDGGRKIAIAYKIVATAGTETPGAWQNTGGATTDEYVCATFAVKPAAGGGGLSIPVAVNHFKNQGIM